ncbi:multidrug ABC transporter ATP-binding protein [Streptomyces spongiicola]|uniref:Multidrug ABC transporter ATP-binding protein n=1 Tax=Streptomyces spongiicola TaxID=1690221 RepID=A0ABN5KZD3_9ACTN|nr:ABC transporter ATP-binding protein [Streptomyces spongiicola]AWK12307.1 multidrug ABC transporter ATP-binding protein [Streptomyces spongiicola]
MNSDREFTNGTGALPAIDVSGLVKAYGNKTVVNGLTFQVRAGVVTGFLGPNGAGKSTTMRMMLGLDRPTAGRVLISGRTYRDLGEPLRHVGALLDAGAAHPGRTARDHLLCIARANRIPDSRVDQVLEQVGMDSAAKRRIGGFSLGMRQRLGIAAALLGDPQVLILDEPVNGLDPEGIRWLRHFLKDLAAQGRAVLISSHLMTEMALLADRLIVIGKGSMLADVSMAEFAEEHGRSRVRVRSTEAVRLRAALLRRDLRVESADDGSLEVYGAEANEVGRIAAREGTPVLELSQVEDSLEDAFMRMTADSVEYVARTLGEVA